MGQPLNILQRWQHQRNRKAQLKLRTNYLKSLQFELTRLEQNNACQTLKEITKALETFRDMAYPSMQVRVYDQGWSVGVWKKMSDGSQVWNGIIDILPRFERSGEVLSIEVFGHNRRRVIPANEETVLDVLVQLYFPQRRRNAPVQ